MVSKIVSLVVYNEKNSCICIKIVAKIVPCLHFLKKQGVGGGEGKSTIVTKIVTKTA